MVHRKMTIFKWCIVLLVLAVPATSIIFFGIGVAKHTPTQLFGENLVGAKSASYYWHRGAIYVQYSAGWEGNAPFDGSLADLPGVRVERTIVTLTGQQRGDAILFIQIEWWLLAVLNIPFVFAIYALARPLLKASFPSGHCPACGYDLRDSPKRCPECGLERPTT